jgi:hypothetical protein
VKGQIVRAAGRRLIGSFPDAILQPPMNPVFPSNWAAVLHAHPAVQVTAEAATTKKEVICLPEMVQEEQE